MLCEKNVGMVELIRSCFMNSEVFFMPARHGTVGKRKKEKIYDPDELVFALDIGTRTVIGIVGEQEGKEFRILSSEIIEHKRRAMLDGQIQDIECVADTVKEVKVKLEKNMGITLTKVSVAAAGRVLKTCKVKLEKEIDNNTEIDQEMVGSLEIEAIQKAQVKLEEEMAQDVKSQFYCVGYSIVNYYLNGYVIANLAGQKGCNISVEVLATFLPRVVIDSLYTVMGRAGLEVSSLTLEPIAAINVAIPKDLRLLNLSLVDIGAGTSDIALTRGGTVAAYAMVSTAGDEITERICQHYLVDFSTGEKIKMLLSSKKDFVEFTDILGSRQKVTKAEVTGVVEPAIKLLADTISQKICEYNKKSPNAVFLIGGGSQIPGLAEFIAECLGLPQERVAVRGRDIIQNLKVNGRKLSGPDSITPIGIAVTAQMQKGHDFFTVSVNGKKVKLFNTKKLKVADALILVGFNPRQLIGRMGKSVRFTLNGIPKTVSGGCGKAAQIFVNNGIASIDTDIKPGDSIVINAAKDGEDAKVFMSDIIKGEKVSKILDNGTQGKTELEIFINNKPASLESEIHNDDVVRIEEIPVPEERTEDLPASLAQIGKTAPYSSQDNEASQVSEGVSVTVNGKMVLLHEKKEQYIFVDVFNFVDFDLSKPQGNIVLKLNGKQAAFTDTIRQGDSIEIYWDKR